MSLFLDRGYSVGRTTHATSIGVAAGILIAGAVARRIQLLLRQTSSKEDAATTTTTIAPPLAPESMLATLQRVGGLECPAFFRDMAARCDSLIYQLNVPPILRMYTVGDYKAMREVFLECDKPAGLVYSGFDVIAGVPSIFSRSTHDPVWKAARKGCSPAFSSKEVNRMNQVCADQLRQWINTVLEPCVANGTSFDPCAEMSKLTFSIIMESAFEYENVTQPEYDAFLHDVDLCLKEFTLKCAVNPFRTLVARFLPEGRKAYQAVARLQVYALKILHHYRAKPNKAKENTLIKLIDGLPNFDDKQKVAEMTIFMIGGHDTTGFSLGNALCLAARHQSIATKVRQSLADGSNSNSPSEYFQCFLSECNRLIPVSAGGSARLAHRDFIFTTPQGPMKIPKGSVISMPQILPNYDASVYDEPDEFRPERWLDATEAMKQSLMMFALGKRNCIGQSLATAELRSVLPALLTKYHFTTAKEGRLEYFLTLKYVGAQLNVRHVDA